MKSLKKTEKIFSNSIDISTKAEYIVTIKSYLHPNKRFGKERKMKKVLSVLAVLAVAAGFAFADADAAANFGSNGNTFKLKTTVKAQPHVFFLSTDGGSNALAADEVVDKNVDLTKDGTYDGVKLYLAAGGNQTMLKEYTVTVEDTDFKGVANPDAKVKTNVVMSETTIKVPAGKTSLTPESTVTVSWTGDSDLAADTYIDTITVTVGSNH